MSETIDVPTDVQPQAVAIREPTAIEKAPVTAAQAKVDAVASLTFKAYEQASTLALTPKEIKALQEDFPDEAFKPGAGGNSALIYIEHAFLRDRLNNVLGLGQWALIPRSRWAEDFVTAKNVPGSRIYVEAMLLVRGAFVSEAVGSMEYFKNNASQNYGDAVEGAKTAALRRCCKEFGVGLQAWKKDWCAGWWERRNAQKRTPIQHPRNQPLPTQPQAPPASAPPPAPPATPTDIQVYPIVSIEAVKEVHSKPDAKKPWTVFFVTFHDGFGQQEAGTFDSKLGALAQELAATHENASMRTKPGRKEGSREIVSLARSEAPPEQDDLDYSNSEPDAVPEVTL